MKTYSQTELLKKRNAIVFPVVTELPDPLEVGETVYKNDAMFPGLYIYLGNKRWVTIMTPKNNIFEEHIALPDQKIFNLNTAYPTDGNSINVYVDSRRLQKEEFAELGETIICIKEDGLIKGGERIEFQIFNQPTVRDHIITV
jgi:hypothetical protein